MDGREEGMKKEMRGMDEMDWNKGRKKILLHFHKKL